MQGMNKDELTMLVESIDVEKAECQFTSDTDMILSNVR